MDVAIAPPPDVAWALRRILRNPEALQIGHVIPMRDWMRVGSLDGDDEALYVRPYAQSPLANAARMNHPLLVVAGGEGERVGDAGAVSREASLFALETLCMRTWAGPDPHRRMAKFCAVICA